MRLIAIVLFIALGVGALAITISNDAARVNSYETALAKARDYAGRGLAYPAANAYVEALGVYNGDFDVAVEYVEQLKLVDMGMISDRKELVGWRRTRVVYHLEPRGEAYLQELLQDYRDITQGVFMIVEGENRGNE